MVKKKSAKKQPSTGNQGDSPPAVESEGRGKQDQLAYSWYVDLQSIAASLPLAWLPKPPVVSQTFLNANGLTIISTVSGMDSKSRSQWYRNDNQDRFAKCRHRWQKGQKQFESTLAARINAALENAIELQGHLSPDTLKKAESLADDLRGLAVLVKTSTVNAIPDGPFGLCQWRHNGTVTNDKMQNGAWQMVQHLWGMDEKTECFDNLKKPVYGDIEHIADANAYGSMRKAANKFFKANNIPWQVSIKGTKVSLCLLKSR